jgi:heat shock protein HslJ
MIVDMPRGVRPDPGRRPGLRVAAAGAVLLFAVTACGGGDDDVASAASAGSAGASTSPTGALEGTTWELTSALGVDLAHVSVTARFADGTVAGSSGCNRYTTSCEVDGSSLTLGTDIAATGMACGPAETAVERAYLQALPQVTSYVIDGSTLTLEGRAGAGPLE